MLVHVRMLFAFVGALGTNVPAGLQLGDKGGHPLRILTGKKLPRRIADVGTVEIQLDAPPKGSGFFLV